MLVFEKRLIAIVRESEQTMLDGSLLEILEKYLEDIKVICGISVAYRDIICKVIVFLKHLQ